MKKHSRKLLSLLMVFALLSAFFCDAGVVNAKGAEAAVMPMSESARRVTVSKGVVYDGDRVGTINCIVSFTYGLPTGKPLVGSCTYTVGPINDGYSVGGVSIEVKNGNPAKIIYTFSVYKNGKDAQKQTVSVSVNNSGNAS